MVRPREGGLGVVVQVAVQKAEGGGMELSWRRGRGFRLVGAVWTEQLGEGATAWERETGQSGIADRQTTETNRKSHGNCLSPAVIRELCVMSVSPNLGGQS
jgi:hypothetical protein